MIEIVLATDAAHHFNELAKFKSRISAEDFAPAGDDKLMVIKMMVHLADISNPVKSFKLAKIWTGLLYDEFFKQGDREMEQGRDISFLMDRKTVNIAGSSIGFSKMLVQPAYAALADVIPLAQICIDNLNDNITKWEELKDEFEEKKQNGCNFIEESRGKIKDPMHLPRPKKSKSSMKMHVQGQNNMGSIRHISHINENDSEDSSNS
mmetsp:Transcript_32815/g.37559  ORF Transcript_32815/g.37559 Transcript_32815/m.37559 type:complete len:207 (-) Transcript_32815:30-650(-)